MKRRNFLASLFALPFVAKPLEALVGFSYSEDVDWLEPRLELIYEHHRERVLANTEQIRRLTEALLRNAPFSRQKASG